LVPKIIPDKIVDFVGLYCPEPVFRTRTEIDKLTVGKVLEVIADDPASEEDISRLIKNIDQKMLTIINENDQFHFFIKKIKE
jgi:TusA-related sulfurtransferase